MKEPITVTLEKLSEGPYTSVLCYPKPCQEEVQSRLEELRSHSVTAIEFSGKTQAQGIPGPIIGKGYAGVVVVAHMNGQRVALKILRVDADRPDLLHEARMLQKANSVNVGPKLVGASKNFLLTQLIDGDLLPQWLELHRERELMRHVLGEVLANCCRLDEIGLDHGELSKAPKHVIIDHAQKPWLLDFETSSDMRKPANVTAICHFLFSSLGEVARTVEQTLGERNKELILKVLRNYKIARTRENFGEVLRACLG